MQSQILPVELDPSGKPRKVNLPIGDDIAVAAKAGKLKAATLRVQFVGRAAGDKVEVALGGKVLAPESEISKEGWVTYRPAARQCRLGDNALSFRVTAGDPGRKEKISVRSVELVVDYR